MLIAQVTDVHLGFEPGNPTEFNRKRLDQVVAKLCTMLPSPDALILSGDLVDRGDLESYALLKEAIAACPFPIWPCVGNHDDRTNFSASFPDLPLEGGFAQYAVESSELRLIVLDTLEEGRHGGSFCESRAEWLSAKLGERPEQPTLIIMHHPPVEVGLDWMNTHPSEPWVARFLAAIGGHKQIVGITCGHLHRPITCYWNKVMVMVCASTAPQVALDLMPIDPEKPDGRPMIIAEAPGYALHRWTGDQLVTHFDTADEPVVLARYDERMQGLVRSLIDERPPT